MDQERLDGLIAAADRAHDEARSAIEAVTRQRERLCEMEAKAGRLACRREFVIAAVREVDPDWNPSP